MGQIQMELLEKVVLEIKHSVFLWEKFVKEKERYIKLRKKQSYFNFKKKNKGRTAKAI